MKREVSKSLYEESSKYFPGGVNSPVRAFKAVGGTPLFIEKGAGSRIFDADGNEFIDFCGSFGPLILGHANQNVTDAVYEALQRGTTFGAPTKLENKLAELILKNNKKLEKIRFVNSGTEAAMSAIRLARGYTGRNKIIKFEGCYHGHVDALLVKAGSGLATLGTSTSAGVPEAFAKETIVLPLNDIDAVKKAVKDYSGDIACIALEPIPANNGLMLQDINFLKFLREICAEERIVLFFDEVISGFRVGFEGAAGLYGIQPDVVAYGKIIGGGLPVGAYGASKEIMAFIAPEGPVYQAGTLSGNPVAMAAGIAQLTACLEENFYENLEKKTSEFCSDIQTYAQSKGYSFQMVNIGSIFWFNFSSDYKIRASAQIDSKSMESFKVFHHQLLENGVYLGPSGYEVGFISAAHSQNDLKEAGAKIKAALDVVFKS